MSELRLNTDGHIIKFGADNDVSLTHVADTGLLLNSTMKLQFNDASQFIQGSSATVLSIGATDEIDLTATAVDLNGTLNVSGVATFQAAPVFPDGSLAVADLDIDGATDIGAAVVDADLFIIDDGAGGTNRKVTAARIKTYIGSFDPDAAVVFNESSNDVDFRVEGNGIASLLHVNAGDDRVGIGGDPDLGASGALHIKLADSGASVQDDADALVIEDAHGCGMTLLGGNDDEVSINFGDDGDNNIGRMIYHHNTNDLTFVVNAAARMEIQSTGFLKIGAGSAIPTDGTHPISINAVKDGNYVEELLIKNTSSQSVFGKRIYIDAYAPDNNSSEFYNCRDTGGERFRVFSDGDVQNHDNSYGAMSDERIKQNITDSGSQWDDIKALKVRKFKKKDDVRQYADKAWEQIGVIAQELEAAGMDKLVEETPPTSFDIQSDSAFGTLYAESDKDEDGNLPPEKNIGDVKEVKANVKGVKYSIIYMKAIKALQEAQTRIETLESKVTALEG